MLATEADSIAAFQSRQRAAFQAERRSWLEKGLLGFATDPSATPASDGELPAGSEGIETHVPGSVWKINIEPGARVEKGQVLVIVESMKMEIAIESPFAGVVTEVLVAEGRAVSAGQRVAVIKTRG